MMILKLNSIQIIFETYPLPKFKSHPALNIRMRVVVMIAARTGLNSTINTWNTID